MARKTNTVLFKLHNPVIYKKCNACGTENRLPKRQRTKAICGKCKTKLYTVSQLTSEKSASAKHWFRQCINHTCEFQEYLAYHDRSETCPTCLGKAKIISVLDHELTQDGRNIISSMGTEHEQMLSHIQSVEKEDKEFIQNAITVAIIGALIWMLWYHLANRTTCDPSVEYCREFSGPSYRGTRID